MPEVAPLHVLAHPAFRTRGRNPYNSLLYSHLVEAGVLVDEFSRARLLAGGHSLWHLHWPEENLNSRSFRRAAAYSAGLLALLDWAKWRGIKIVWTIHNLQAHEGFYPRLERWFWQRFAARVDGYISLSRSGQELACDRFPALQNVPGFVIPHGHYRDLYPVPVSQQVARATLGIASTARVATFVGQIRPYKNLSALITEFQGLVGSDLILLIAGSPLNAELSADLSTAARKDARIRLDLRFLSEAEIQLYVRAADLVVLPYQEVLNSGSAVLALSLDRPILVPKLGAFTELQEMVGEAWVSSYEGQLSASDLELAFDWAVNADRAPTAPLQPMDWELVAAATLDAYVSILTGIRTTSQATGASAGSPRRPHQ